MKRHDSTGKADPPIAMAVANWPAPDRAAWLEAKQIRGRLSPAGPAAKLAPATWAMMETAYGTYLAWLDRHEGLDPLAPLEERVTPERLAHFLDERRRRCSDNTVYCSLAMMTMMLHCIMPSQRWTWVRHHPAAPTRAEARAARKTPRTFDPARFLNRLIADMDAILAGPLGARAANRYRDDLLDAIAILSTLRRRNLREMRFGQNLVRHRSIWMLSFEPGEAKTPHPIAMQWPARLVPHLERYIADVRPVLAEGPVEPGHPVFPVPGGGMLAKPSFDTAFTRTARRIYGKHLNPHSVRHTGATLLTTALPNAPEVAAAALGHRGTKTLTEFYDHSATDIAQSVWLATKERLKRHHDGGSS